MLPLQVSQSTVFACWERPGKVKTNIHRCGNKEVICDLGRFVKPCGWAPELNCEGLWRTPKPTHSLEIHGA